MYYVSARRVLRQQRYKSSLNITQSIFASFWGNTWLMHKKADLFGYIFFANSRFFYIIWQDNL